jgi:hypothetical protein
MGKIREKWFQAIHRNGHGQNVERNSFMPPTERRMGVTWKNSFRPPTERRMGVTWKNSFRPPQKGGW